MPDPIKPTQADEAEMLLRPLRSALRFAASRSAITAFEEKSILVAFTTAQQAREQALEEAAAAYTKAANQLHGEYGSI